MICRDREEAEAMAETSGPRQTVARFEMNCSRFIAADGTPTGDLPAFARDCRHLVALHGAMLRTRTVDEKAAALQRT
jgi:hypothetical protein